MKAEGAIKNEQSRETGSIWYTRHKMKKNVRESRETSNIGFIRHRTKTYNTKKTSQKMLNIIICKHSHKENTVRHEDSWKQLDLKTNRT